MKFEEGQMKAFLSNEANVPLELDVHGSESSFGNPHLDTAGCHCSGFAGSKKLERLGWGIMT